MDRLKTSFAWLGWDLAQIPPDLAMSITTEENMAYAKALVICAKGDGQITPQERQWLIGYSVTVGHPDAVVETTTTYEGEDAIEDVLKASPAMPTYRRFLLYDALRACASDGELAPGERERVLRMADRLGVARQVVAEIEQLVQEDQELRQRKHKLLLLDAM